MAPRIAELDAAQQWRPIEEAPEDGMKGWRYAATPAVALSIAALKARVDI